MSLSVAGKTYWLIGASAGIGASLARELDRRGASLVLSARSEPGLQSVAATLSRPTVVLPFDVTDPAATHDAADRAGQLDGVIYMAGDYSPMTAQGWDGDRAATISAVNYTGALHALGASVPGFARAGHGHVVIIGSLAGFSGLPGAIGYGAGKAALMHLAQNMRSDLKGTGVRVQLMNPGFVDTRLTRLNEFRMPFIMTPEAAATRIANAMERRRFSTSFPSPFAWLFKLRAVAAILRM